MYLNLIFLHIKYDDWIRIYSNYVFKRFNDFKLAYQKTANYEEINKLIVEHFKLVGGGEGTGYRNGFKKGVVE